MAVSTTIKNSRIYDLLSIDQLDGNKSVKSHFVSPLTLAITRTLFLIFCLSSIILKFIDNAHTPINYVMYLTNLSFYGIAAYITISTFLSWRYIIRPNIEPWSGLHWIWKLPYFILYQSCNLISIIVSIVYWTLLAENEMKNIDTKMGIYLAIVMHSGNSIVTITEMLLSQNPVIFLHLPIILVITLLYAPYAIVLRYIYKRWPYFFLDYENKPFLFTSVLLGIVFACIVFQYLFHKLHQIRDQYGYRKTLKSQLIDDKDQVYA